ncbi:protein spindle-F-like [Anopheles cruzii]|uniref:protein spindle-F-like n=1 Tax=Anopheles cruzii TaxID=68878 RepID=UPI0022EC2E8F|nr:protein spindle-F-like [Anopheles cruzii]XP_052870479.1 protein spindle-F-like [Anopheles cruzii]
MSGVKSRDPNESECYVQVTQHGALQAALQTLKERCQTLQKRISTLEDENLALRTTQTKTTGERGQGRSTTSMEVELLRHNVLELSRQKAQLAEQIAMIAGENRQLWGRLSQIVKDFPLASCMGERQVDSGDDGTNTIREPLVDPAGASPGTPAQNLIRSRTFTKNAPNPKLRARLPHSTMDEQLLNLEDVSLLNACEFLEKDGYNTGNELPSLGLTGSQSEELLEVALEANPDLRHYTDGLLAMQLEVTRQQLGLKSVLNQLQLKKELCRRCKHRQQQTTSAEKKPIMKDVTVEVTEGELVHVAERRPCASRTNGVHDQQPKPMETSGGMMDSSATDELPLGSRTLDLLQEKLRANSLDKMCPMCGKLYAAQAPFNDFQHHVESHFLEDGELGDLSLDRTYEYVSQTVGNF